MGKNVFIDEENLKLGTDISSLSDEMTFRRYMGGLLNTRKIFRKMSTGNYVTVEIIERLIEKEYGKDAQEDTSNRIYLKDLAAQLKMPMPKVSETVRDLNERGMVVWTHDGKGTEGTYITLTESGIRAAHEQQAILNDFYSRVIGEYGREKFISLLDMMADLDQVMETELEKIEADE